MTGPTVLHRVPDHPMYIGGRVPFTNAAYTRDCSTVPREPGHADGLLRSRTSLLGCGRGGIQALNLAAFKVALQCTSFDDHHAYGPQPDTHVPAHKPENEISECMRLKPRGYLQGLAGLRPPGYLHETETWDLRVIHALMNPGDMCVERPERRSPEPAPGVTPGLSA